MSVGRALFKHEPLQPLAVVIEELGRPHIARNEDEFLGQLAIARPRGRAGEMALQAIGQILEIGEALAWTADDLEILDGVHTGMTEDDRRRLAADLAFPEDGPPSAPDLRTLVRRSGDDNDLVEATRQMPALQRVASPAFRNSRQALERLQPVLEFARPYTPDLVGWFRDFGQGASNYDANGHFARIQPIFNAYSFTDNPAGGALAPIPAGQRLSGLTGGQNKRCPGAASQAPTDGSAPWQDSDGSLDCDKSQVLPGP